MLKTFKNNELCADRPARVLSSVPTDHNHRGDRRRKVDNARSFVALLGRPRDTRVIATKAAGVRQRAIFVDVDPELRPVFDERGIEWVDADSDGRDGNEVIIRREISASGRSKVYINDRSVTLHALSCGLPSYRYPFAACQCQAFQIRRNSCGWSICSPTTRRSWRNTARNLPHTSTSGEGLEGAARGRCLNRRRTLIL